MKFSTKEDIEAPIEYVFEVLSDFESFERSAMRRGAEIERHDGLSKPGNGMLWQVAFQLRGKPRQMALEMVRFDPPNGMEFYSKSAGLDGVMVLDLVAMSRKRTRLSVDLELKPQSLAARLMVQSLKLARGNLNKRYHLKVAEYAKDMEDRYRRMA
jgi:uncharacterized protein YndB with AHSA1/START domain